jgi:hypothetical protein
MAPLEVLMVSLPLQNAGLLLELPLHTFFFFFNSRASYFVIINAVISGSPPALQRPLLTIYATMIGTDVLGRLVRESTLLALLEAARRNLTRKWEWWG